ncbi:aminotransferase class V-fold PLP-dependent enzyme [Anaerosinus massiliensis]|uniref:aminotransferase class V-fold PLP-dependent enzyme n=1 Tax=Massilibacillus massiliensis TaxID=1806837 RepID=UPI000B1575EB|nr:aminotransferase class V-fold PLP-dependent enzyme [Massilibacillus massiliensis]
MIKQSFVKRMRQLVVGIEQRVPLLNGKMIKAINFDNAATTPPFISVMNEINEFALWYSSVHRGMGYKSILSSDLYENGRATIKNFVGADEKKDTLIYTKTTTEAINLFANAFHAVYPDAVILSTEMEHLANDLPWRYKFAMDYVKIDAVGKLDLNDLENKLIQYRGKVKLVSVTGASNVTGYINSIYEIAKLAHTYGAEILVDGAQLVPHWAVDMKPFHHMEHIDYLVFSAHKMYAPFGIGIFIGKNYIFKKCQPFLKGGGAVELVTHDFVDWDSAPYKEEAGTPNVIGVAALLKAIDTLKKVDMQHVHQYEQQVIEHIICGLRNVKNIKLFGCPKKQGDKVSIISFTLPDIEHRLIAKILSYEFGIAVRSGLFCAHPYVQKLLGLTKEEIEYYRKHDDIPFPGMVRVSLGLYNTHEEADILIRGVHQIANHTAQYIEKYRKLEQSSAYEQGEIFNHKRHYLP